MDGQVYYWSRRRGISLFGIFLIAVGTLWLLDQLEIIQFRWGILWAVLIIAIGLSMVLNRLFR